MPSLVWNRDPQEAFDEPYEYGIQEQFVREADAFLIKVYRLINAKDCKRYLQDKSRENAEWLLAMDGLDSLRECLGALQRKEHRIAGKLFRDVMEAMDLAVFFHSQTKLSIKYLHKWYEDEVVPHRHYRDFVKKSKGLDEARKLSSYYSSLSRFTHRSYRAILDGYSRGVDDWLVHDGSSEVFHDSPKARTDLVLPATISTYFAVLAGLIQEFADDLECLEILPEGGFGTGLFRKP
jgi:hypothetical protein